MKNILFRFIITATIIGLAHQAWAQHPKEAVCAVCRVHEGTTEPEKVVAFGEHQGATHYFCSKKCMGDLQS